MTVICFGSDAVGAGLFYLSWVGYSAKDNSERTPSVLVAQLRDHLSKAGVLTPKT